MEEKEDKFRQFVEKYDKLALGISFMMLPVLAVLISWKICEKNCYVNILHTAIGTIVFLFGLYLVIIEIIKSSKEN